MIKIAISNNHAQVLERELLTSGTVGKEIYFIFGDEWDGLNKTAVFEGSGKRITQLGLGESCTIPHEVMAKHGGALRVGVYGRTQDGSAATPTIYAQLGMIQRGADPNADPSTAPTLAVWEQIQDQIGDLSDLMTEDKADLVAAINEAAKSGGGSGTTDHSKLTNRDKADQHPTSAITGLTDKLQEVDTMLAQRVETDDFGLIQGINDPFTNPNIPAGQKLLLMQRLSAGLYNQGIHFRVDSTSPMVDVVYYVTSATAKSATDYSIIAETVKPDGTPVVMTITPNDVTIEERTAVFYVDIVGTYPNYSYADESFNMTQIAAEYKAGKTVLLRHISEKTGVEGETVDAMYTLSGADTYDSGYMFFRFAADLAQIEVVTLLPFVGIMADRMELVTVDDIPSAFPNPNALTLNVGDGTTIYDGSEAKELTIPTADNTLGLTGATVGQIAKISAVDDNGKPTAWEPVDMPSGGGGTIKWYIVADGTIDEETNKLVITEDNEGTPLSAYNAVAMLVSVRIPADSSQESDNGSLQIFATESGNGKYRALITVVGWKTVTRFFTQLFFGTAYSFYTGGATGGSADAFASPIITDFISAAELSLLNKSAHFPVGTKFCITLLSGGKA